MSKRYIRLDIEYESPNSMVVSNIRRILAEDMPYVKIFFSRDTPNKVDLDESRYDGHSVEKANDTDTIQNSNRRSL